MEHNRMEVDPAGPSTSEGQPSSEDLMLNPLKRSNSAPMINALGLDPEPRPLPAQSEAEILATSSCFKPLERVRRFSTSSMALNSSTTPMKGPSRLIQIRHEESVTQKDREVAHEREIQSAMQLSQSMEEIFVDESMNPIHQQAAPPTPVIHPPVASAPPPPPDRRPKSLGEPLHIHVSQYYPYASSPSPTRLGKQCFSPSLQQPVYRTGTLTPSPSPSPTRKTFASPLSRRSLSPITLRPSPLGNLSTKRKMDLDGEKMDTFCSPAKRFHASSSPGGSTPERAHMYHQLLHSVSSSSWDASNSPDQRVPNNLSTVSTASTTSSPASFFRPVRESTESRCTDSETSDMAETTDISEHTDMSSSQNLSSLSHMSEPGVCDPPPGICERPMAATLLGVTEPTILPNVHSLVSCSSSLSSSSLSPSLASGLSSVSPSVSSMSPQPSSASCESSSSSLLTQPMSGMSVSQGSVSQPASQPTAESAMSSQAGSASVQYFSQSSKVTQV